MYLQVISQRRSLKSQSASMQENEMLFYLVQLEPVSRQQRLG
jgi:hypothetical protein